ncbi:AMP-binding enzyme [Apiospora kogelbergensis]|uniref:AMP-binding enzyme n=1 Tax=Apiospora kogelbergensis TaxID=1337665 RepID=UPI003132870D
MPLPTQFEGVLPLHMVHKPPFSVQAPGELAKDGETAPFRHAKAKDGLIDKLNPDIGTIFELLKHSTEQYADQTAVGTRKLVKIHKEVKKVAKVVDGETKETLVFQVGAGLRKLGMVPGDIAHLFASTSRNWLCMAHACSSQSMTIATAYDTLGSSGVQHSLVQTGAKAMFTDPHLLKTASGPLKEAKDVQFLIWNDMSNMPFSDQDIESFKKSNSQLEVLSFSELRALGESNPTPPVPPRPTDLYCIMYTSGTSGPPKGVPITHEGIIAGIAGLHAVIAETVSTHDVILAYLPLAHIFELIVENLVLYVGGTMGYGSPRTLVDSSMRNCAGDLRELRPTIMVGVPQVWETVKKGVESRVNSAGALTRAVFWGAYNLKSALVAAGLPGATLLDNVVFGQVRQMTGNRLRFIFNGASGISAGTMHFMSMVVAPMISGYGLTETCASGALGCPLQWTPHAIGPVPASVELKLVSLPELNYNAKATPPQGEILLRGKAVLKQYYKNPEETAKALTADGWFKTGDIGELDPNGHIKVIDRVKNLVKMQGGEYIALEKLEAVYRGSTYVQNIMVYGDGSHPRAIAILTPNEKSLAELAKSLGVDEKDMHHNKGVRGAVLKDLLSNAKQGGLSGLEMISGLVLVDEEWTPANGLTTATSKVNRRVLKDRYKKEIEEAFEA